MSPTRVQLGAEGRAVVVKEAAAGPGAERLRREARVLRRAEHPGVVVLESVTERPDGSVCLTTRHAGRPVDRVDAALLAAVATTLADLHDRDVVHGRVSAEHVLVGADGAPVLCGFGEPGSPADDVAALGRLALDRCDDESVRSVALRAVVDDPAARPGMRPLADGFRALTVPRVLEARRRPNRHLAVPRRTATAGSRRAFAPSGRVVALALLAAGALVALVAAARPTPDRPSPVAMPTTTTTTTTTPCPRIPVGGADVDGDGCREPVLVDGGTVLVDGERWRVGVDGDVAAVGDWDCDGTATAAVLRPTTGELFTYDGWGDDVAAAPAGSAPGATRLAAVDGDGDGCDELRAV